jgi:hypothetical protein
MKARRPPLRSEPRECLAQSRRRREAAVEDLGEPFDFGICQLDPSHFLLGDLAVQKALREKFYGSLDPK